VVVAVSLTVGDERRTMPENVERAAWRCPSEGRDVDTSAGT
jgi:hypothetical protein